MKRTIIAIGLTLALSATYAIGQTLIGTCAAPNSVDIQMTTGKIFCVSSSPCAGSINLSSGCALPMLGGL